MYLDVVDLRNFYGSALGGLVRRSIRAKLIEMWPRVAGDRLLGLGYATPFLRPFLGKAERVIGFMPGRQGVVNWPSEGPSSTALVDETALPLPDSSIDRMILIHALEMADDPEDVLREVWRVLAPGGMAGEAKQVMDNIQTALQAHGLSMADVVKCTVMLADMSEWGAFNDVYKTYFSGNFPARSAFGSNGLAFNARVEVECIAAWRK